MRRRLAGLVAAALIGLPFPAAAHPSYGIVVDEQGRITFSDLERVWRIDPGGRLRLLRPGGDWHTHELAIDGAGAVYGEQSTYVPAGERYFAGIWRITPDDRFSWVLRPRENPPTGLSLWRDRAGATYASHWRNNDDRRLLLLRRTRDGRVTVLHGSAGDAARVRQVLLSNIGGTTVGPDGAVWLTNGPELWRAAPSGLARRIDWRDPEAGAAASLRGLFVDAGGVVTVADMDRRRVLRIDRNGRATVLHRSAANWSPTGVALGAGGLLVLEAGLHATLVEGSTRVLRLSGPRVEVLATVPPAPRR